MWQYIRRQIVTEMKKKQQNLEELKKIPVDHQVPQMSERRSGA